MSERNLIDNNAAAAADDMDVTNPQQEGEDNLAEWDDDLFSGWQAPSSDQYAGWPSVPRRLPRSGVEGILHNSSIDTSPLAIPIVTTRNPDPTHLTPAQRREQNRRTQARLAAAAGGRQMARDLEEARSQRTAARRADVLGAQLRAHYRTFEQLNPMWVSVVTRFQEEDAAGFATFARHSCNCSIVKVTAVPLL